MSEEVQVEINRDFLAEIERIAETFDITTSEVVRRGIVLVSLWANLRPNESIAVYNEDNGALDRVRLNWGQA